MPCPSRLGRPYWPECPWSRRSDNHNAWRIEEQNDSTEKALRSFSRTFVLGPGAPGGQPIRVVSDMLTLRAWGPLALPKPTIAPRPNAANNEQQIQQAMTMQLVERTGMTPDYSAMCLTETGWDLEKAFVAFTANKVC